MKYIRTILAALLLCAPAQAQTLKSLMYNTSNNVVALSQAISFQDDVSALAFDASVGSNGVRVDSQGLLFGGTAAATTRTNLGLGATNDVVFDSLSVNLLKFETNSVLEMETGTFFVPLQFISNSLAADTRYNLGLGATWLTNANVTNFRTAIGLGATNDVVFQSATFGTSDPLLTMDNNGIFLETDNTNTGLAGVNFTGAGSGKMAANTRTNLGLGATNIVTFAGLTNNGDITINQTATNNGLLYIYRTNAEPFLGLANLIASNNTTISNETLFRVGVAEATNRSAQFGFRSTNTNGNGVAVFSVFGYNALMMIGPSDPAAGTNPIQATVYSINPTNKVMTLITTNTGAMQMHRPIGIDTAGVSTNAPANTTNVAGWIQFYVGTNSVRVPYYQ